MSNIVCDGSRTRTKDYVGMCEFVTETGLAGTVSRSLTYLMGPFGVFAVVEEVNGTEALHYVLKDNLGSWTVITDADGIVEQRLNYDAWGNLRNPQRWTNYASGDISNKPMFDRGFTGHEHLSHFGLINMNGRMYDPVMSSFLSVDRFMQTPLSAQDLNPYAYCMYNPLRYVDPTGWAPRPGGGHGPDNPPYVVIDGWTSGFMLDGVTIIDSPLTGTNSSFDEFEYTPYYYTIGGGDSNYGNPNNAPSLNQGGGSGGVGRGGRSGDKGDGGNKGLNNIIISEIQKYKMQYEFYNILLGYKIASYAGSDFNKRMFLNYWYGLGDYELSTSEFTDLVSLSIQTKEAYLSEWNGNPAFATPVSLYGTAYDNAIGTTTLYYDLNGNAIGIHELYDFNLLPLRDSKSAQIKTTLVWCASKYNVHNKDFYINYNYHP